jgi:glycosyltransferase involved in cell wall biosynthesis
VLFFVNTLSFRGTTTAVLDYAKYNQTILGNESVIGYRSDIGYFPDGGTEDEVYKKILTEYEIRPLVGNNFNTICNDIDFSYFIRAGYKEEIPDNTRVGVHAVFQYNQPHGDKYAYISRWLSWKMSMGLIPFVPHIVNLPPPTENVARLRNQLGLKKDDIVIGRIGGYETFDIDFVKQAVADVVNKNKNIKFLMLNTKPFYAHERIKYINPITSLQLKSDFINLCDGFLHARSGGESFGLAIAEALYFNKPVLCYEGGHDQNHVEMLRWTPLFYNSSNVFEKINSIKEFRGDWSELVSEFNPEAVMRKFNDIFLKSN